MTKFTIEIMQTLLNKGDLDELFQDHLERAINSLLQAELTAFLDYENMIEMDSIQEIPVTGIIHVHLKQNMAS